MTMDAKPVRCPLWRGSQMVRALWLDAALLGEAAARMRILAMWESGARAFRVQEGPFDGYLIEWPRARRLRCERAGGLPLCEQGGLLTGAPLDAEERARLAPGGAAARAMGAPVLVMVLVQGAVAHAVALGPEARVDPSCWIDLSALPLCVPLALPSTEVAGFVEGPAALPDVRAILGGSVRPPSAELEAFIRRAGALRAARGDTGGGHAAGAAGKAGMAAAAGALGLVGALAMALGGLFRRAGGGPATGGQTGQPGQGEQQRGGPPPGPGLLDRLADFSRMSALLGWRQARYLRNMVRQFEQGDLDEALRHAIPLGGDGQDGRRALGLPGRRGSLDVTGGGSSASSIGLDPQSMEFLRKTYQKSFEALDRAGRVDEAAFVLAELLNRGRDAVEYLEQKGRLAKAAQMAETLALDPAVAVRLYCLAGDSDRAVRLARLASSFGPAVEELERRQHPYAAPLRVEWAEWLAACGNPVGAAMAIWPLAGERASALAWLELAEGAGGALGVRGLLYRLVLAPPDAPQRDAGLLALLEGRGDDAARGRAWAADCLLGMDERGLFAQRMAGALWRRLMADRDGGLHVPVSTLSGLLTLADDPLLRIDSPKSALRAAREPVSLRARTEPLVAVFAECGLLPVTHVRRLPDGGYLLALGEGGALLLGADGRERCRFPAPADRIVLSATGQRALAVAQREKTTRVSRIDLLARRVTPWFRAELEFWADEYDGATWSVVAGQRLMALDCEAPQQKVLWQVADLPDRIVGFEQRGAGQALLLARAGIVGQWRYTLPQRRLVQRDEFEVGDDMYGVFADPNGDKPLMLQLQEHAPGAATAALVLPRCRHGAGSAVVLDRSGDLPDVEVQDDLVVIKGHGNGGAWRARFVDFAGRELAAIELPDARNAGAAVHDDHLLVWDARGRIVDIDIATGAVRCLTVG